MELNQQQFKDVLFAFLPFIIIRQYVVSEVVGSGKVQELVALERSTVLYVSELFTRLSCLTSNPTANNPAVGMKMSVVDRETSRIINT